MERSFNALLDSLQPPSISPATPATPLALSLESTLFPHGILLAIHHVLLDSKVGSGSSKARKNERTSKQVEPSLNPEVEAASGVPDDPRKNVIDQQARREVMARLLDQALRALRLSLLIVGEHNVESSSFVFEHAQQQQTEPGGDEGPDIAPSGDPSATVGGVAERRIGGKQAEGARDTAIHAVASAGRSSRSVNANGHMGGIALDHRRRISGASSSKVGKGISSSKDVASSKGNTTTEGEATGAQQSRRRPVQGNSLNDGGEKLEAEAGQSSGAAEGQRAVVGAWLLTKESCRCLATIVTTCGIPHSSSHSAAGTAGIGLSLPLAIEAGKHFLEREQRAHAVCSSM